jgi:hypothetical protein
VTTKAEIDLSRSLDYVLDVYNKKTPIRYDDSNIEILMDNGYKFNVKTYKTNMIIITGITHNNKC